METRRRRRRGEHFHTRVSMIDNHSPADSAPPRSTTPGATKPAGKHFIAPSLIRPLSLKAPTAASLVEGALGGKGKGKATATQVTLAQDIGGDIEGVSGQDRWGRAPLPSLSKKERKAVGLSAFACSTTLC